MKWIRLTSNEQWGLFGLSIILLLLSAVIYFKNQYSVQVLNGEFYADVDSVKVESLKIPQNPPSFPSKKSEAKQPSKRPRRIVVPSAFDPNKVDSIFWINIGFTPSVAGRIVKYKNASGGFHRGEDLLKVYGLQKEQFELVKDSLFFEKERICINGSSDLDFQKIPGVGKVLSKRIVAYRDLTRGFYEVSQLNEVYGLDLSKVDTSRCALVLCNKANRFIKRGVSYKELVSHPYINGKSAKKLILLLSAKAQIERSDLQAVFPDSIALKIKHYLHE